MFDTVSLFDFGKQVLLAIAGASSFWGMYFIFFARKKRNDRKEIIIEWVAYKLVAPLVLSVLGLVGLWVISHFIHPAYAHEGISILPTHIQISNAVDFVSPFFYVWAGVVILGAYVRYSKPVIFQKIVPAFFIFSFTGAFFLISIPGISEDITLQSFFAGHGFHSIFTVGTVLMLDYLFILGNNRVIVQQNIFPFFPLLSKVIWVGLGIDFASVLLIFPGALSMTPVFFFIQTIVGIIIINGVLLSGPLSKKMLGSVERGGEEIRGKWSVIASLCGVVSVVSWLSITFLDFFKHIEVSYSTLSIVYVSVITILFGLHRSHENYEKKRTPLFLS